MFSSFAALFHINAMRKLTPNSTFHPVAILFLGLAMAQILAVIHVYLSNIDLYTAVSAVNAAGYVAIPNKQVMTSLRHFWPAFAGGLFFTLSIGAAVSLGSMAAAWSWTRAFKRNKFILILFLLVWTGFLASLNIRGFTLMPTLYFLLIPPVPFLLTAKHGSQANIQSNVISRVAFLLPIPLLGLLWFTQFDDAMFVDLRDNLLLSNVIGQKFSHFYYTYTLYPAEAFKSLDQKSIRTCRLENIPNRATYIKLVNKLLANDYFPLPDTAPADLKIIQKENFLSFQASDRRIFQVSVNRFLAGPNKALHRYSRAIDRHTVFRQFTFLSILIGFPVLIYLVVHTVFYGLGIIFLNRIAAALTASALCLLIGVIVLIYFQANRSGNIQIGDISEALNSDNVYARIAALKIIERKKVEIAGYREYPLLRKSRIPQERYWFVRTLAVSRRPATFSDLLNFINDRNINVRSMAFYSLGLRNNRTAIGPILEKIKVSHDWYTQMYAYKALRTLGWMQTKSL
jgi:hypothetical protein